MEYSTLYDDKRGGIMKEGECPNCGNMDIEWGDRIDDGPGVGYEFHCPECNKDFVEWYDLTYVETLEKK